jgi:hypothetical protein
MALASVSSVVLAQAKPEIKGTTLRVVRPGMTETLRIYGENLAPESVTIGAPLKARVLSASNTEKAEKGRGGRVVAIEIIVPEKATTTTLDLTLHQGKEKFTLPITILETANTLPENREPNREHNKITTLTAPIGVFGHISADRCDYYRFEAKEGEVWEVRLRAGRLGSALDGMIRIRDHRRVCLGLGAGDERKDRSLSFKVPKDGAYLLEICDAEMRGGDTYTYHLSLWKR